MLPPLSSVSPVPGLPLSSVSHFCTFARGEAAFAPLHFMFPPPATRGRNPPPVSIFHFCTSRSLALRPSVPLICIPCPLVNLPAGQLIRIAPWPSGPPVLHLLCPPRLCRACFAAIHHASSSPSAFPILDTQNSILYLPTCFITAFVIPSLAAGECA